MNDFTIITRSLTSRLFSTVVTVVMVATAVALMLVLLSMRHAGRAAFDRGAGDMHMIVSRDESPLVTVLNGIFHANAPRRPIDHATYERLASAYPWSYAIPIQQGDSYLGFPVIATERSMFEDFQPAPGEPWRFAAGGAFDEAFEVVVGASVARTTGLGLGDEIFLTHGGASVRPDPDAPPPHVHLEYGYEVVGVLEPTGGPPDRALYTSLESSWVIHAHDRRKLDDPGVAITTAEDLVDADRLITGIYLRLATREGARMSGMQQQVFDELRRDPTITVADPGQEIDNLFAIVSNLDEILLAMALVVMISSGIAIMLALYNSMEQRRRQVAVLRVLGCSRGRVFGLIVTESALLGIGGAAAGVVLALVGAQVVAAAMKARLGLVIAPTLPLDAVTIVSLGTIALASAAGVIPAAMAYRTSVVRNLRPLG